MRFVSYAQNYEDVMLWRALRNVENGFYVDVGANDPVVDSVTKAFYERGWTGVNIEPLGSHYEALLQQRPLDINLNVAVGEVQGEIDIWDCGVRGWGTADKAVVEKHQASGHTGHTTRVPLCRLDSICEIYATRDIHFLKVDVEGLEKSVLLGMDFVRFRPWIVVVEATKPNSRDESHEEWEDIIVEQRYSLAYADGLNRYYLAEERAELRESLRYPPNVFDEFYTVAQVELESEKERARLIELSRQELELKFQQVVEKQTILQRELENVYSSNSWRATAPLRQLGNRVRDFFNFIVGR